MVRRRRQVPAMTPRGEEASGYFRVLRVISPQLISLRWLFNCCLLFPANGKLASSKQNPGSCGVAGLAVFAAHMRDWRSVKDMRQQLETRPELFCPAQLHARYFGLSLHDMSFHTIPEQPLPWMDICSGWRLTWAGNRFYLTEAFL